MRGSRSLVRTEKAARPVFGLPESPWTGLGSPQRACAGFSPASQILPAGRPHRFRWLDRWGTSCLLPLTIASRLVIVVVGIGADGWDGLSGAARRAVEDATVVLGGARQLALL